MSGMSTTISCVICRASSSMGGDARVHCCPGQQKGYLELWPAPMHHQIVGGDGFSMSPTLRFQRCHRASPKCTVSSAQVRCHLTGLDMSALSREMVRSSHVYTPPYYFPAVARVTALKCLSIVDSWDALLSDVLVIERCGAGVVQDGEAGEVC